jgi:hypothetical protein
VDSAVELREQELWAVLEHSQKKRRGTKPQSSRKDERIDS